MQNKVFLYNAYFGERKKVVLLLKKKKKIEENAFSFWKDNNFPSQCFPTLT